MGKTLSQPLHKLEATKKCLKIIFFQMQKTFQLMESVLPIDPNLKKKN